jgi:hypothetical protein
MLLTEVRILLIPIDFFNYYKYVKGLIIINIRKMSTPDIYFKVILLICSFLVKGAALIY